MQIRSPGHCGFQFSSNREISLHGISGLTILRLARELQLLFANEPLPRVIILEIRTTDLSSQSPEIVIGVVLDLVDYLRFLESSKAVGVCKVIPP